MNRSDHSFNRPSLGRAALVVLAIVAMFAAAHEIAGVRPWPGAQQAHVQDAAPSVEHIRLD